MSTSHRTRVPETVACPLCGRRLLAEATSSPRVEEARLAEHDPAHWGSAEPGWTVFLARHCHLIWACDICIGEGRALRARPWRQVSRGGTPRLAYFDISKTCRTCGSIFVYSAAEQQQWYEERKLPPWSEPADCLACRQVRRARKEANMELARRLACFNPRDSEQLAEIAALYLRVGSVRKASEFLRRAKNQATAPAKVAEIVEQLARLARDGSA